MKESNRETPITKYHLQELTWRDFFRVFLPLIIVVLTPLGYGLWRTLYGYSSFGPAAAAAWGKTWFYISGILIILLLLYTYRRLRRAHTWINFYSWGLELHFPPGRKRILKWDEIVGITSYSINKSILRSAKTEKTFPDPVFRTLPSFTGPSRFQRSRRVEKDHQETHIQNATTQAVTSIFKRKNPSVW